MTDVKIRVVSWAMIACVVLAIVVAYSGAWMIINVKRDLGADHEKILKALEEIHRKE